MSDDTNQSHAETSKNPGHYVREWRNFMGWSQEKLADMADVSQAKIARLESGERQLKASFLKDLARIFRVPQSALLEVNPATETGAQTAHLLLAWDRLTTSQRNDVLKMVRALSGPDDKADAG
jgi:transcriptional regulator with XRE-family HTH domain